MTFWVAKVLDELKWRNEGKYNVDKIEQMLDTFRHPPMWWELPPEEWDWVAVVEITTTEPEVDLKHPADCECEECKWSKSEEKLDGESEVLDENLDEESKEESWEAETPELPTASEDDGKLEPPTPAEQDRMDEVLKAIKTFFPNENTEDVLVRMVTKLIDL